MGNLDLLLDACARLPHTRRAMFGGHGLFAPNGGMFAAIVDEDRIALKLPNAEDQAAFQAEGARPWVYQGQMTMAAWLVVPDELYDAPQRLAEWARLAHATAVPPKPKGKKAKAAAKRPAKKAAGGSKRARRADGEP